MGFPTIKYYFPAFIINHNLISIIQGVEVENNKQEDGKNGYPNGFEVDFFHHGFSSESGYFSSKVILFSSDTCKSKIFRIFVLSDQWLGSKMAPENRGFFNPIQYGGGKGIKLCEEWHRFLNFRQWAINNDYKETLSIERKNPNLDYSPSNCTWIPRSEQNDNKGNTRYVYYNGVRLSVKEACKLFNIQYHTLIGRLERGWPDEEALSVKVIPYQKRNRNVNART